MYYFQLNHIHAFVDPGQGFLTPEGDGPFYHKIKISRTVANVVIINCFLLFFQTKTDFQVWICLPACFCSKLNQVC
jgi:hypothetical protein